MIEYFDLIKGDGGAKSVNQHDGFGDLLSECRVSAKEEVNETEAGEAKYEEVLRDMIQSIKDDPHYDVDKLIDDVAKSWDIPRSQAIEIYNKANSEEYLDTGDVYLEESKINELDEPDLERPEKARRRPKKRRPLRPKPDVDEVPKEEPDPDVEVKEKPPKDEEPEVPEIGKEPDLDEVPPPPEEVKEPEAPIEMRKEYLGRSEETHYYFITTEGEGGVIDDFVITDQEGVKKYSAKDKGIEVTEEGIADFIIEAIRDMDIAQIERSIFMKYVYPKLVERAPEEEIIEEPEEEPKEEKDKGPLGPEEEEGFPRESKKVNEKQFIVNYITAGGGHREATVGAPSEEEVESILKDAEGSANVRKIVSIEPKNKVSESKNLIEMKVTNGMGNEFDVNLVADDTEDAVININGREFRFSPEFASMWKDEEGNISEEGLEELALDALAMMEEDEYQKLLTKGVDADKIPDEGEEPIIDIEKSVPGETDWLLKDRPEPGEEEEPDEERTTDDVDVSKGDIHRRPKYRPKKPEPDQEEVGGYNEGKNQPGVRDGTGPAKASYQRRIKGDVGKRKEAGEKCPEENKENEDIEGDNDMDKNLSEFTDEQLREELEARKEKTEGIDPKKEDNEEKKIKKLAEEEEIEELPEHPPTYLTTIEKLSKEHLKLYIDRLTGILTSRKKWHDAGYPDLGPLKKRLEKAEDLYSKKFESKTNEVEESNLTETDVAKGAKALIKLAKEALHDGNYRDLMDYSAKLAAIEDVIPEEAEAEAEKEEKAEPEPEKDDKEDKKPEKEEKPEEEEPADDNDNTDEKKKPPVCSKCGKRHWPFEKCGASEEVGEAKDKKDKEAKAKKAEKEKKDKADKKAKAKEDKEEAIAKAKEEKAKKVKKESKIQVESTEDISERKGLNLLNELLEI